MRRRITSAGRGKKKRKELQLAWAGIKREQNGVHGSQSNNLQISPSYQMGNWDEKSAGQTNQRECRLVFIRVVALGCLQIQANQESRPRPDFQFRGFAERC